MRLCGLFYLSVSHQRMGEGTDLNKIKHSSHITIDNRKYLVYNII